MTEPLQPSNSASKTDTPESSSQRLREANDRAKARQRNQPKPIAASIPKIESRCRGSEHVWPPAEWAEAERQHNERSAKLAEAERRHNAKLLYAQAGCPKRHRRELELTGTEWLQKRDTIIGQLGDGFMVALLGKRGPGKTQLAQQVIKAVCDDGRVALYARAMTIFYALRATYGTPESEQSVIDHYCTPALLVIDELQERGCSVWEDRTLVHILDNRYGEMLDTLLVANLEPKAFEKSMGPSITERLRETGGIVECSWESFRK